MFGQVIVGAPGSGKTTFSRGVKDFLNSIERPTVIVNLDPGNDVLPYEAAVNIMDLISLDEVMDELQLGPNGGLIYCVEYMEKNLDWLKEQLEQHCKADQYVLFDCPGQVEIYTHHTSMRNILAAFNDWGWQLCVVHLVDAHHCSDASKFVAASLMSLASMTMLELPHVNILSKIDLVQRLGRLDFNLDYYTSGYELARLPELLVPVSSEPRGLNAVVRPHALCRLTSSCRRFETAIANVVDDFSLVNFIPTSINDKDTIAYACRVIDKANGYLYLIFMLATSREAAFTLASESESTDRHLTP
ncbi:hypothetical protein GUITHDRAFT_157844 [Guillardia theta CCMP2712]|uniref:GPN-loop GTPase 2 n=1 Tax=Guillardia theta (strain CCMP2712) TaxID=905079 RepID=L1JBP4_GUITC|nr:hypothetical protein GUITHDRAFT_157844 [Guillardia theta CCMP2712]EKX45727.1 hypothetical protein GUITHDRAFT_157844 [Guillardia theta CCMP2712]|eukprot:XP_005832707.1 hypothetical protein GUITHDRAFT_157844 [Guillardia theta CCMP2712]